MKRFAFSGLVCVLVACGGANSTDLFSGDTTGGGTSLDGSANAADGSGGGGGNQDGGGGGGGNQDSGGGGGKVDSGTVKDSGTTSTPCTVDKGGVAHGCGMDEACISSNCTTGLCQKIDPQSNTFNPICGCDTVNYWNTAVAAGFLAGVKSSGACANPATCNGAAPGNAKCGVVAGADCAFERPDVAGNACGASLKSPACWGMPQSCPKVTQGVSQCIGGACLDLCSAITNQTPFRVTMPACTIM